MNCFLSLPKLLGLVHAAGYRLLWTTMQPVNTVAIRKACLSVQASMSKLLLPFVLCSSI